MIQDSQPANPNSVRTNKEYRVWASSSVVYQSYLLRMWREDSAQKPWRMMLESITEPGERQHFSDLESLFAFLRARLEPKDLRDL
jgi:hypothetical protein